MKKKILIVEDEEMLLKVLNEQFEKAGFEVSVASDGEKALESLEKSIPDLVLLDIILPKMNGFDVLKAIKENPNTKDIPVIIISNLGQDTDIKQAIKLGAVDYFIKAQHPIFEIIEKVDKFLSTPKSPLEKPKTLEKEKKAVKKTIEEKPSEKIAEKPVEKAAEKPAEKIVKKVEKVVEKIAKEPEKEAIEEAPKEAGEILKKIIGITEESAKQVIKKQAEKAAEKPKAAIKPEIKKIEAVPVEAKKPIEKKIKKEEKYPQLPKSARKFIRMKKAELNKMELEPEKYEEEVAKLYQTFSPKKKTESAI